MSFNIKFPYRLQSLFKKLSLETFKEFKIQDIVVVYLLHKSTFSKHPLIELQLFNQVSLNSDQLSHAILKRTQFYFVCPVLNRVSNGADWLILTISSLNVNIDTNFKASQIHDSFKNLPPMVYFVKISKKYENFYSFSGSHVINSSIRLRISNQMYACAGC